MKEIILVGGGGHCRACIDVLEQTGEYQLVGIVDFPENIGQSILGYKVIATDNDLPDLVRQFDNFLISIGQIKTAAVRKALYEKINKLGGNFPSIISPLAYVSPHSRIGRGTIVMHDALVSAGVVVADNCIINSKALLEHDVSVGSHCHISTGSIVNGGVSIGDEVFLGSGSICRESVSIGSGNVIGFGTSVPHNR